MKQPLRHEKRASKLIPLTLGLLALGASAGAHAKTINAETGPIIGQVFANIQCEKAAVKYNGKWNGKYWTKPGSHNGVCQIVVPDPVVAKPIKRAPIKPGFKLLNANAGRLWSQDHANARCPTLAKEKNGTWTGNWSKKTANSSALCQVRVAIKPVLPKQRYKYTNVSAGRIWSQDHANTRCKEIARQHKGTWTSKWATKGTNSTCQVKIPVATTHKPQTKPVDRQHRSKTLREVSAGRIWDQNQANKRCPAIATQTNGKWTGKWRKTGSNNEAVCEVRLKPLAPRHHAVKPANTTPATTTTGRTREVPAGQIWDAAQANTKCPKVAAQSGQTWTGKWRKLNYSTHQSVCEVSSNGSATTVVTTSTTYVNLPEDKPATTSTARTREIYAGPIWDANQASVKCPVIAANNNGTWTGVWRKTNPDHSSLCEVRF